MWHYFAVLLLSSLERSRFVPLHDRLSPTPHSHPIKQADALAEIMPSVDEQTRATLADLRHRLAALLDEYPQDRNDPHRFLPRVAWRHLFDAPTPDQQRDHLENAMAALEQQRNRWVETLLNKFRAVYPSFLIEHFPESPLLSISEDQQLIEPTTVRDRNLLHKGVQPARFTSLYTRDDPTAATVQIKAEIGPTEKLYSPEHVLRELNTWSDVFKHAMQHYLGQQEKEHTLPDFPMPTSRMKAPLLEPSNIEYEDSRPVILDGAYIDRIDRRLVMARVEYEDVEPGTTDYQLVESAMYSLSHYMRKQLSSWYNRSVHPVRFGYSVAELVDAKEREKQRLFGDVT